ncbi:hypothetical protein HK100_012382 [Physocladia obscura]|uniref:Uncharacterized protein n=1 Tax=Physocladia obscura TaxID=109957 RepID=A0AAD5T9W2_9FUNG|nr:hypothetical protein HK100_012382 [Physocladia obscura]
MQEHQEQKKLELLLEINERTLQIQEIKARIVKSTQRRDKLETVALECGNEKLSLQKELAALRDLVAAVSADLDDVENIFD